MKKYVAVFLTIIGVFLFNIDDSKALKTNTQESTTIKCEQVKCEYANKAQLFFYNTGANSGCKSDSHVKYVPSSTKDKYEFLHIGKIGLNGQNVNSNASLKSYIYKGGENYGKCPENLFEGNPIVQPYTNVSYTQIINDPKKGSKLTAATKFVKPFKGCIYSYSNPKLGKSKLYMSGDELIAEHISTKEEITFGKLQKTFSIGIEYLDGLKKEDIIKIVKKGTSEACKTLSVAEVDSPKKRLYVSKNKSTLKDVLSGLAQGGIIAGGNSVNPDDLISNDGSNTGDSGDNSDDDIISGKTDCDLLSDELMEWLRYIFNLIKIVAVILAIILVTADFIGVVTSGEDDALRKVWKNVKGRLVALVILLIAPTLIEMLLNIAEQSEGFCNFFNK